MPRERITHYQPRGVIVDPGGPDDGKPAPLPPSIAIDVRWQNGHGGVGVETTATDDSGRITLTLVNEWLEKAHMPLIDVDKLLAADPGFGWRNVGGFNANLDNRDDVNRLIRVLRRARDGAFGKDA